MNSGLSECEFVVYPYVIMGVWFTNEVMTAKLVCKQMTMIQECLDKICERKDRLIETDNLTFECQSSATEFISV